MENYSELGEMRQQISLLKGKLVLWKNYIQLMNLNMKIII